MFGNQLKKIRINNKLSLQKFCKATGEDPGNWSKIEREISPPPIVKERLINILNILQIKEKNYQKYILMAYIDAGKIPEDIDKKELLKYFLRKLT